MRAWVKRGWKAGLALGMLVVAASCSSSSGSGGGGYCPRGVSVLQACGFTQTASSLDCQEPTTKTTRCFFDCQLSMSCAQFEQLYCAKNMNVLQACIDSCSPTCSDGTQISISDECNGQNDCPDGSDEAGCPTPYQCADGQKVSSTARCDGYLECSDGSDEAGCPTFQCGDGQTVPADYQCDGTTDCSDGSDELNCPSSNPIDADCSAKGY